MPKGYRKDGTPFGFKKGNQLGKLLKGIKRSVEFRKKSSERMKGNKRGLGNKNALGKHHIRSEEYKAKFRGEKHWHWKGGYEKTGERRDFKYIQWRSDVFQRDNWTCQTCGKKGIMLHAHHIKGWSAFPNLRYEIDNGVSLCIECHKLTDNYGGRSK